MIVLEVAQHLPEIRALCQQYGVERMSIIGSATNEEKFSPETSDVDCLVKFFDDHENLNERFLGLGEALEKACHRPVEVIFESALQNDIFRKMVEKSKVVIYDKTNKGPIPH
ncbi:MAG: hypothetical protein K2W97_05030 [Chthoniobacterales bacterium]|nr:hypothetical protein [Chthoniobacterales bacterium]